MSDARYIFANERRRDLIDIYFLQANGIARIDIDISHVLLQFRSSGIKIFKFQSFLFGFVHDYPIRLRACLLDKLFSSDAKIANSATVAPVPFFSSGVPASA